MSVSSPPLPRLSIVTVNFNQGEYLEETIDSVLSQGYPNLEYILIDGGSRDRSPEIIARYAKHFAYHCSEPDRGQYDAVNKGMTRATGEVLAYLSSDDKYMPGALRAVGGAFAACPEVAWMTSLLPVVLDAAGHGIDVMRQQGFSREALLDGYFGGAGPADGGGAIQQESTFWRRWLWEKAGGRLREEIGHAADFDLWCRFYAHAELCGLAALVGAFRVRAGQRSQDSVYLAQKQELLNQLRPGTAWRQRLRRSVRRSQLDRVAKVGSLLRRGLGYPARKLVRRDPGQTDAAWELQNYRFL